MDIDNTDFEVLFTAENAEALAQYIVDNMSEGDGKQIDYDFSMNTGTGNMKKDLPPGKLPDPNFWFKFDTVPDSLPNQMLETLCNEDIEPTEARKELFMSFLEKVKVSLVETHFDDLREKIRLSVFGPQTTEEQMPIRSIIVSSFDIADIPEDDEVLIVNKKVPKIEFTFDPGYKPKSVTAELYRLRALTGESFDTILARKKEEGDPDYAYVDSIETRKSFYECQLDMFVDFSFSPVK